MLDTKSLAVAMGGHPWGQHGTGLATAFSQVTAWWLVQKRFINGTEAGEENPLTRQRQTNNCSRLAVQRDVGIKTFFKIRGRK